MRCLEYARMYCSRREVQMIEIIYHIDYMKANHAYIIYFLCI